MADAIVNDIVQDFDYLWSKQGNFRILWNNTAQFVMPAWDNFVGEFAEGVNRNYRLFESTGMIGNQRFGAVMEAMLTPRSQVWHKLHAEDEEANDRPEVKQWLDRVNRILFAARYHPEANFASQAHECYMSLGAFGNNFMYVDEAVGHSLRYRAVPLSELCWAVNHQGRVDTIYRKFKYTAKQAVQDFTLDRCPSKIQRAYNTPGQRFQEFEFLQVIRPNMGHQPGAYGSRGMRFECYYIALASKQLVEQGGYRSFPGGVGRYRVAPREVYGRGPAQECFPDIRTSNEMMKTALRAGQKAVDPPILLSEDSVLQNFNQRPGANNYAMVTSDGKPLAIPFKTEGNFQFGEQMHQKVNGAINDSFLVSLFQILIERPPQATATEVLVRAQEKGELISPAMGRQQSEFLGPIVHRELDLMWCAGQIPPPPKSLMKSGKGIRVEYTSPLARALRAEAGTAILSFTSDILQLAQVDPTVTKIFDAHEAAHEMADIRGVPAKIVRSEEQVMQLLEHAAEQAQEAQVAGAFPRLAGGVKDLAQAAQAAGQAGGAQPGAVAVPQG
jgi:head-to-tail connecting protein